MPLVCRISVSQAGIKPEDIAVKAWILTTLPPGNSLCQYYFQPYELIFTLKVRSFVWLCWVIVTQHIGSSLLCVGSVIKVTWDSSRVWFLTVACGISSSLTRDPNLGPLHWECTVLATALPGKSLELIFKRL